MKGTRIAFAIGILFAFGTLSPSTGAVLSSAGSSLHNTDSVQYRQLLVNGKALEAVTTKYRKLQKLVERRTNRMLASMAKRDSSLGNTVAAFGLPFGIHYLMLFFLFRIGAILAVEEVAEGLTQAAGKEVTAEEVPETAMMEVAMREVVTIQKMMAMPVTEATWISEVAILFITGLASMGFIP